MMQGSGGVGFVSIGIPWWVAVILLLFVAFGVWKLAKLLWTMFGS